MEYGNELFDIFTKVVLSLVNIIKIFVKISIFSVPSSSQTKVFLHRRVFL